MQVILPLTYEDVFTPSNKTALEYISNYPKFEMLKKLAFVGEKVQQCFNGLQNDSLKANIDFLNLFIIPDDVRLKVQSTLINKNGSINVIFSRNTILWGIETVMNSSLISQDDEFEIDDEFTSNMFMFLLLMNSKYLKASFDESSTFEDINASLIPSNSFSKNEIILTPKKGKRLFDYLLAHKTYSALLPSYIESNYGVSTEKYLRCLLRWGNSTGCIANINLEDEEYNIFKGISDSKITNINIERLTSVKKAPIFQCSNNEFIILDRALLLGKIYGQFIYDFWFDWVKNEAKISVKTYFGDIGRFFEEYSSEILKNIFSFLKHPAPLSLKELEYNTKRGTKEVCDFYARHNKKVFIGEIKLGSLNDISRFSGQTGKLYKNSRVVFFEGANQLNKAIADISVINEKFDNKLPLDKHIAIYPVCIFNDSIYNLPTMSVIFDNYWNEIVIKNDQMRINPLSIIHIDQLELIDIFLKSNNSKKQIWDLLKKHCSSSGMLRVLTASLIKNYKLNYPTDVLDELQLLLDE